MQIYAIKSPRHQEGAALYELFMLCHKGSEQFLFLKKASTSNFTATGHYKVIFYPPYPIHKNHCQHEEKSYEEQVEQKAEGGRNMNLHAHGGPQCSQGTLSHQQPCPSPPLCWSRGRLEHAPQQAAGT